VAPLRTASQFHEDLPVQRPLVREFRVAIGACQRCHRRVQGRHPLQTSDALGAAAAQIGPHAVAFAVLLNKRLGLPYGKIARLLRDRFGLTVTGGGLVQAIHRAARQAQPTYAALSATVRGSPDVSERLLDPTPHSAETPTHHTWTSAKSACR
jgi:transposase